MENRPYPAQFWDVRYAEAGMAYGSLPNAYLAQHISGLKPGTLLLPGEGEGRNALWAAQRGWRVEAFDQSQVGMGKAQAEASRLGLDARFYVADIADFTSDELGFDVIALLFLHLPPSMRKAFHNNLVTAMKPGAMLILESFSPEQIRQGRSSGGPKDEALCLTTADLHSEFEGLTMIELLAGSVLLDEGRYHQGRAEVVRMIAVKPFRTASSKPL